LAKINGDADSILLARKMEVLRGSWMAYGIDLLDYRGLNA
jgi:hypothetical protein